MLLTVARFASLVLVGLTLGPSLAHLLELPNKIGLPRDDYLTVQHIYDGWALLGVVVIPALLATLLLTVLLWRRPGFVASAIAFVGLAGAHALFWAFTFPANQATRNWTVLPADWETLRARWEWSHAAAAGLNLVAFVALVVSVLRAPASRPGG